MIELSSRETAPRHLLPVGCGDAETDAETSVRSGETPPVCRSPMPTQVIEFWTPPLVCVALLRALKRSSQGSSTISDEV